MLPENFKKNNMIDDKSFYEVLCEKISQNGHKELKDEIYPIQSFTKVY